MGKVKIVSVIILSIILICALSFLKTIEPGKGETTDVPAYNSNGHLIHMMDVSDTIMKKIISQNSVSKKSTILHLGNSQTQSINQFKFGQTNFISKLSHLDTSHHYIASTLPNINLEEVKFLFDLWDQNIEIDKLLIPVFFDDLRETGLRNSVLRFNCCHDKDSSDNYDLDNKSFFSINYRIGEAIDLNFTDWLSNFSFYSVKSEIRSQLFVYLYKMRNTIFRIKPTTERKMIAPSYEKNWRALESLILDSKKKNILTFLYIPPIRNDVQPPYDLIEYNEFKEKLNLISENNSNVYLMNFENIVPYEFWGMKAGTSLENLMEIDFMHFRDEGHQILAAELNKFLN